MCSSVCVCVCILFVFFNEQISPCNTRGCCKCLCVQVLVQSVCLYSIGCFSVKDTGMNIWQEEEKSDLRWLVEMMSVFGDKDHFSDDKS